MSPYNVFNLYDTFEFLDKHDMISSIDLRNCYSPKQLNIAYLPDNVKEDIIKESKFYNDYHKEFVDKILNSWTYREDIVKEFIEYTKFLMVLDEIPEESLRIYRKCLHTI
jgi:hypothetical protein